ncbi:hypothetical protein Pmani_013211 [Petrolisthes manimaculis]|uniref:Uncharacterized protein n=1 Tax=Petrolisthes manimaculis TaxID=1843537 RepID=A0AAE1PVF3_9EUCA|nr:hypothetical protein Pmani_013211 [Petrolisthes manimaculis]
MSPSRYGKDRGSKDQGKERHTQEGQRVEKSTEEQGKERNTQVGQDGETRRVFLDMSRVTVMDRKEEDLDDLYFYTDIWVPPAHVKTPCTLGIGTMTRLGMVQRFDPKEPTKFNKTRPPRKVNIIVNEDSQKAIHIPCQLDPVSCPTFDFTLGENILTVFKCILDYTTGKVYFFIDDRAHMTSTQRLRDVTTEDEHHLP